MAITIYGSDFHGKLPAIDAYVDFANHVKAVTGETPGLVNGGDWEDQLFATKEMENPALKDKIEEIRQRDYKAISSITKKAPTTIYSVRGNHDKPGIEDKLENVSFPDHETLTINGRTYGFIEHYSGDFHGAALKGKPQEFNSHNATKARIKDAKKLAEESDYLVSHEIPIGGFGYPNVKPYRDLETVVQSNNTNVLGGHVHGKKSTVTEKQAIVRANGTNNDSKGAIYLIHHHGNKDTVYEITLDKLLNWHSKKTGVEESNQTQPLYQQLRELGAEESFVDALERLSEKAPPKMIQAANGIDYLVFPQKAFDESEDKEELSQFGALPISTPQGEDVVAIPIGRAPEQEQFFEEAA